MNNFCSIRVSINAETYRKTDNGVGLLLLGIQTKGYNSSLPRLFRFIVLKQLSRLKLRSAALPLQFQTCQTQAVFEHIHQQRRIPEQADNKPPEKPDTQVESPVTGPGIMGNILLGNRG